MQAANVSHTCNFKFSSSHIRKVEKKGEIDFHNALFTKVYPEYYVNIQSVKKKKIIEVLYILFFM